MKVLVVGTSPPAGGAAARALAAAAVARRDSGDEVEILSPDPTSAAHRSARLDGFLLAVELAWLSRKFDGLELRIEAGVPCRSTTSRTARAGYLLSLGAALRCYDDVTLRLDSPVPIPGGVGGRATALLWGSVRRVVVSNDEDRTQVERIPGLDPSIISVEPPLLPAPRNVVPWPSATDPSLAASVNDAVRDRADAGRRAAEAGDLVDATRGTERYSPSTLGVARLIAETVVRRVAARARAAMDTSLKP